MSDEEFYDVKWFFDFCEELIGDSPASCDEEVFGEFHRLLEEVKSTVSSSKSSSPKPKIECHIKTCKYNKGPGECSHPSPLITLNQDLNSPDQEWFECDTRMENDDEESDEE